MAHLYDYEDEDRKAWTIEPLPTWFIVFLTVITVASFAYLALVGPVTG